MDDELKSDLERAEAHIMGLKDKGLLPDENYYKCMVSLAYEYAIDGNMDKVKSMLAPIPADYYNTTMQQQMQDDPDFMDVASGVAQAIVDHGLAEDSPVDNPDIAFTGRGGAA